MGLIAVCLVSLKGEIGCVVKNSFISYQRITSILKRFSDSIEETRISLRNGSSSVLGGKRIDDVYPIAQPIPMVIGAYRLIYQLVNDIYVIAMDIDHHSPFLALDVIDKMKEVIYTTMKNGVQFSEISNYKVYFYYAFRRCVNGLEGTSVLNIPLRQIRLANDPMMVYTNQNELTDINDCLSSGEVSAEVREQRRDAWEAVIHLEGRIPVDTKKEIKSNMAAEKFDDFFDVNAELAGHQIPETVTTPMVDLIVEEEFDAAQVTEPLRRVQQELKTFTGTAFSVVPLGEVKSASEATCQPLDMRTPKPGMVVEGVVTPEEGEEEEVMEVAGEEQIRVAVPGKTVVPVDGAAAGSVPPAGAIADEDEDEEGNDEMLSVVSIDGQLLETIRVEQNTEGITKQILKGELKIKPECPEGMEGTTALRVTFNNAAAYEFIPEEGKCTLVENNGDSKLVEITLPAKTAEEAITVLVYKGPVPEGMAPCTAECLSSRSGTETSVKIEAQCNGELPSAVEELTCFASPPLLSNDSSLKRTFRFKPKGGFLKTSLKCRWTDQYMEEGKTYSFGAAITEPVDLAGNPEERDAEPCPCELKGKFNGFVSGVRPVFSTDPDTKLHCSYQKREIIAQSTFVHAFKP